MLQLNAKMPANHVCSSIYIPEELIVNILKRLPVKSLLRFMSVCKFWYSLIKNPNFISSHFNHHSNEGPKYLMYCVDHYEYRVYADTENFEKHIEVTYPDILFKVGCCNGIICFDNPWDDSLILWNMSLRKSLDIKVPPRTNDENFMYWFGFDAKSEDYKVIRIKYSTNESWETRSLGVYIYSLNERTWRCVNSSFVLGNGQGYLIQCRGEYLNGVIHWVACTYYEDRDMPELILTFNLADETFGTFHLPNEIVYVEEPFIGDMDMDYFLGLDDSVDLMTVKRGSENHLIVSHEDLTSFNVWVMEGEGVVRSWRKEFDSSKGFVKKILNVRANGELVMELEYGIVISWDYKCDRLEYLSSEKMVYVGEYVENLVLL